MKIVVLDGYTLNPGDNPWDPLAALGDLTVYDRTNPEDVLERSRGAEILITNKTRLNADTLAALPDLRCIGVIATGYDVVDIAAAGKRGIPVMNVVNYGTEAVAQHAFALLLELCRRTALHDAGIRSGRWAAGPDWCFWDTPQVELSGKVMGILGFGTIGRRVAELAHAFGMKVIAASARKSAAELSASSAPVSFPVEFVEMDELFRASDVLSLHCPLTDQTRAIVNAANIASMKDGAILLNLARGPLLDEAAVAEALASGKLGGLGADVVVEAAGTAGEAGTAHAELTNRVVLLAIFLLAQHVIGFGDVLELLLGFLGLVDVRMVFAGELAVRLLDVVVRSVLGDTKDFVEVFAEPFVFSHSCLLSRKVFMIGSPQRGEPR